MNLRIRQLRMYLKMSQEEFGGKLLISGASISKIESGDNNPSPQTIRLICKEFGVPEEWIRTGEGGMLVDPPDNALRAFAIDNGLTDLEESILRAYVSLPTSSRAVLMDAARHMANAISATPDEEDAELAESIQFEKHLSGVDAEEKQA